MMFIGCILHARYCARWFTYLVLLAIALQDWESLYGLDYIITEPLNLVYNWDLPGSKAGFLSTLPHHFIHTSNRKPFTLLIFPGKSMGKNVTENRRFCFRNFYLLLKNVYFSVMIAAFQFINNNSSHLLSVYCVWGTMPSTLHVLPQ